MVRSIRKLVAGAAVAAVLTTGFAFAQGPLEERRQVGPLRRADEPGRGGRGGALPLAAVNLTQAQQDLIRDIRERNREAARSLEQKLRPAQAAQRQAMDAIPANENAIRAATLALAEVQADIAIHQARTQNEIWNALTADQQAQVRKLQAERDARRAQQRERRSTQ